MLGFLIGSPALVQAVTAGESATFRANSPGATDYQWTFPNNDRRSGPVVQYTFDQSGQYAITLEVTGADGQTNQVTKNVNVQNGDRPTAIIEAQVNDRTQSGAIQITSDDRLSLSPNFTGQQENNLDYFWSVDGQRRSGSSLNQSDFKAVGSYQVALTVFNKRQTELRDQTQLRVTVQNQAPVVSSLNIDSRKEGQVVRVQASAEDPDGDIESYRFEVLENGRSLLTQLVTQSEASFNLSQFPGEHTFSFRVTAIDDAQASTRYDHPETLELNNEVINNEPELKIILAPGNEGTIDQAFNFLADAKDKDGDALKYQWIFPNGDQYFASQVRYNFTTGGEKTIQVRVSDGIATIEDSVVVNVIEPPNQAPEVQILAVTPSSDGDTSTLFRFSASGSDADRDRLTYSWDMGNDRKAIGPSPTYRFSEPGSYPVTVTVTDGRETATDTTTVNVTQALPQNLNNPSDNRAPVVSISALNNSGSTNDTFRFFSEISDPDTDPLIYTWDMGDGTEYFTPQATHIFTQPGTVPIKLRVSDGLAVTEAQLTITVTAGSASDVNNTPPQVRILSVDPQLSGTTDTVFRFYTQGQDDDNDQLRYEWEMGDGQQMFIQNPAYRFAEPGTYTVKVRAHDGLTDAVDEVQINVIDEDFRQSASEDQAPTLSITAVAPSTNGSTQDLFRFFTQVNDPDGDNLSFNWEMGDGGNSTDQNPIYRYELPGNYLVTASVTDGKSTTSTEINVNVEEAPFLLNNPDNNQAPNGEIQAIPLLGTTDTLFQLNGNVIDPNDDSILYKWDMGDGTIYFTPTVQHQYEAEGEFPVKLQVTDGLGTSIIRQTVTVQAEITEAGPAATPQAFGSIDQAGLTAARCERFLNRLSSEDQNRKLDYTSVLIADRENLLVQKWQTKAQAAYLPIQAIDLPEEVITDLSQLGVEPTDNLRSTHQTIVKAIKREIENDQNKTRLNQLLSLRKAIAPIYNPSEDKANLTDKKARLESLKDKWQGKLDFTTDPVLETKLENDIQEVEKRLQTLNTLEQTVHNFYLTEALAQRTACLKTDLDPALGELLANLAIKDLTTPQLIDALADVEGTLETTFFLYAKASEIYERSALLFEWNLGDTRSAVGQNINFKYPLPGIYEVQLKISDELTSSQDRLRIRVYETWPK